MEVFLPTSAPKGAKYGEMIRASCEDRGIPYARFMIFGLEGTLVESKSGKRAVENWEDTLVLPGVTDMLSEYRRRGLNVVIITNQTGGEVQHPGHPVTQRLRRLATHLRAPIIAAMGDTPCRKPSPTIWQGFLDYIGLGSDKLGELFYCGGSRFAIDRRVPVHRQCTNATMFADAINAKYLSPNELLSPPLGCTPGAISGAMISIVAELRKKTIVLIVGHPNSGKTELGKAIRKTDPSGWELLNDDELGRSQTRQRVTSALASSRSVILDSEHASNLSRQDAYDYAKEAGARVVVMWVVRRAPFEPLRAAEYRDYELAFEEPQKDQHSGLVVLF